MQSRFTKLLEKEDLILNVVHKANHWSNTFQLWNDLSPYAQKLIRRYIAAGNNKTYTIAKVCRLYKDKF
jgi:hypothetical protein